MSHFHGRFDYLADEAGRVNMPARFRKALNPKASEKFVICRGPNNSLRAYPQDLWEKYEEQISSRPETPESVRFRRLLYNTVSDSTLDSQGRITLSPTQMKIASITKNVTLVGADTFIEIWDTASYDSLIGKAEDFDQTFYQSAQLDIRKLAPQ